MLKAAKSKTEKVIYSAVIVIAAIAFPLYFLSKYGEISIKLTPISIFVAILYFVFVVSFILVVFNKEGPKVTSEETDKKLASAGKKLNLFLLIVSLSVVVISGLKIFYDYFL